MGLSACDIGKRVQSRGESLTIIASEPETAEGLDCQLDSGAACGLPVGGPLRFKFDRWLLPTTATRQSLTMFTSGTGLGVMLRPSYDVASRTIEYNFDAPMPGGLVFNLRLSDADQDPNGFGFRGFDGVSLSSSATIAFRTSVAASTLDPTASQVLAVPNCADALGVLRQAGCSGLGCHSREASSNCASPGMAWDQSLQQCVNVPRMGLLLDVVPNHMGVGHGTNPWWQDVLQNGRTSKFADFFDIEWNPLKGELHNKVLLPILGNQYGEELDSGRLVLKYADGNFRIDYYDKILRSTPRRLRSSSNR